MLNDKVFKQEGGDKSTNLQGQTIVINNGITYEDAKGIALDVFKSNYLKLSTKAANIAKQRAEELVDDYLQQMMARKPEAINTMEDPGMQYAIFSAQKEYAKTGDKNLSDMLVDILVDRASIPERNLKQIVLDESLLVVPKLTTSQIDIITLIFILRHTQNDEVINLPILKDYLIRFLNPFIYTLSKEDSLYQHIEYTGCGTVRTGKIKIGYIFLRNYTGLFFKGFTIDELKVIIDDYNGFSDIFIACLHDNSKLQINALNEHVLENNLRERNVDEVKITKLKELFNQYRMSPDEVENFLEKQADFMKLFIDYWDNSSMKNLTLTSVGIAIATANLRRKAGISVDLDNWIK